MNNPFRSTITKDPWKIQSADVQDINSDAFELCRNVRDYVRTSGESSSVILYGEAGSGKTHLLGRLISDTCDLDDLFIFIPIRLQSSPHRLWRYVRRCMVENLLKKVKNKWNQIELIYIHRLREMLKDDHELKKIATTGDLSLLFKKLSLISKLSWNHYKVLEHILFYRKHMDAYAWLKGNSIPDSLYEELDLARENEEDFDPEDHARQIVLELCRMCGTIPVIFCFDQIEALQRYSGDLEGLFVFGQMIRALHDETDNVLFVSCIQSFYLEYLKKGIMEPDYAALAANQGTLNPLTPEQAMDLVSARLESYEESGAAAGDFLTFLKSNLQEYVGPGGRTAREILTRSAEMFDIYKKGASMDPETAETTSEISDEEYLNLEFEKRRESALVSTNFEYTDEILQNVIPYLITSINDIWKEEDQNRPLDIDILMSGPGGVTGLSFCNHQNMTSLAARLKRLYLMLPDSNIDKLYLIRHTDLVIGKEAKRTHQYLEKLRQENAGLLKPDTTLLTSLESIATLLADARSGDLANGGRIIGDKALNNFFNNYLGYDVLEFFDKIMTGD